MRQSEFGSPTIKPKCRDMYACGVVQALRCCRCIVTILLLDRINATGIAVYIHSEAIAHTKTQSRLCQSDKGKTVVVLGAVIAVMVAAKVLGGRCLSVP